MIIPSAQQKALLVQTRQPALRKSVSQSKFLEDALVLLEYNYLKKDLKAEREVTRYMESPGMLWIDEYARFKKGYNFALVTIDFLQKQNAERSLSPTSALENFARNV